MKLPVLIASCAVAVAGCTTHHYSGGTAESSTAVRGRGAGVMASGSTLSSEDSQFVRTAALSGVAEVQMGQLEQQKGQSEGVKDLGRMLVSDHQSANQQLMGIASRAGLDIPTRMSMNDMEMINRLSSASGAQFDQLALSESIKAHEKAIQQFQQAESQVQDPDLKAFIEKTLPVLQSHLKRAQELQGGNNSSQGAASSTEPANAQGGSDQIESPAPQQQGNQQMQDQVPNDVPASPPMDSNPDNKQ